MRVQAYAFMLFGMLGRLITVPLAFAAGMVTAYFHPGIAEWLVLTFTALTQSILS